MFKKILFYIGFLCIQNLIGQVTFAVVDVPENTPKNATIYISGDFEGWTGGNKAYKLTKKDNGFFITIPKNEQPISFKFTQGTWDTVERDNKGNQIDNRNYKFKKENDTVAITIASWDKNDGIVKSTQADNVFILSEDFEIPQLQRKRRVWLYLPPNYKTANTSFPVIYMHDGQNLFDTNTSYSGEWSVDETLNKLYKDDNASFIVVGIDNGTDKRLDEYSPWKNKSYGGGEGDAYLEFIVNTLKPYIDSHYKTQTTKESTAIIGSSMGGLISHYAALKYPDVFGKIGVFSPAFWFAPEITPFSKTHGNIKDTKMYFLAGGKEGENTAYNEISKTVKDMNTVINVLKAEGFPSKNIQSKIVPEGKHNETLWKTNFEETIRWLFPEAIKKREFISAKIDAQHLVEVKVTDGKYRIIAYTPQIIETSFIPNGEIYKPKSHAVILKPNVTPSEFTEDDTIVTFKTLGITVKIQKKPFQISYWYKGKQITSEKNGYQKTDTFETIQFNLTPNEVLYGGGARALGMNRRGNRLQLYNKAHYGYETRSELMNFTLPIVLSSNKYMLHFDNAPIGFLDLDSNADNTLSYETISGRKTYQVIVGNTWQDITKNYTSLTGRQPLPPRWALGNFASRFGYHSQAEVEATITKFREENIPVDAIILDLYWFGKNIKGTMGNLQVLKDSFPDFKGMTSKLKSQGVKTIAITEPFILTTSKRWQEAVNFDVLAKDTLGNPYTYDFYFGNTGLIDVFSKNGKSWFQNVYKEIANLGVDGVWGDLGEPEVHPSKLMHATGTADEVHNIYGHNWVQLVKEFYTKEFPNQRPFILMRAGAAGSQRFGMIPWSGDVNRSWGGLQSQTEIALQMSMQGLAYMHSDLGGFAGENLDDELYVRWLQYGVFQPIYRPHAQESVPAEPVFRAPKAKALAKKAIELRYKLLPYNYTLAFNNSQTGLPLMRPLLFEESDNEAVFTNASTYLWGNDFLITPVTQQGAKSVDVYFPKRNNWFNFYTDEKVNGGQTKTVITEENSIPTYVRGGAFIPMAKSMQSTNKYFGNTIDLHYYFDASVEKSKSALYNDDGHTRDAYKKGDYELLTFEAQNKNKFLELEFNSELGSNYSATTKHINVIIHNVSKQPKRVHSNGETLQFNYKATTKTLTFLVIWDTSNQLKTKLKF